VVLDEASGEVLGQVGNLTIEGVMICSDRPLEIDRLYSLQIELPDEVDGRSRLNLLARSLWCQRAGIPAHYATGLELLNLEEADKRVIELLIQDAVFQRWTS
jgi:hypothetical protein